MKGSGVRWRRRKRSPRTKKVPGRSRLTFKCHDETNIRNRERERERKLEKYQAILISNDKNWKVRMHENA